MKRFFVLIDHKTCVSSIREKICFYPKAVPCHFSWSLQHFVKYMGWSLWTQQWNWMCLWIFFLTKVSFRLPLQNSANNWLYSEGQVSWCGKVSFPTLDCWRLTGSAGQFSEVLCITHVTKDRHRKIRISTTLTLRYQLPYQNFSYPDNNPCWQYSGCLLALCSIATAHVRVERLCRDIGWIRSKVRLHRLSNMCAHMSRKYGKRKAAGKKPKSIRSGKIKRCVIRIFGGRIIKQKRWQ